MIEEGASNGNLQEVYSQNAENGSTSLQIRLAVENELEKLEFFLRGLEPNTYFDTERKINRIKLDKIGEPMVNNEGFRSIMAKARMLVNGAVFQGNIEYKEYLHQRKDIREEIADELIDNYENWEINRPSDLSLIADTFMNIVEFVLTRPIGNKERDAYNNIQTRETTVSNQKDGFFRFGGGKQ